MVTPEGAFAASLDADSEGVEGKFYVWTLAEIREVLGPDATLFAAAYDVTEHGNWEETNIPNLLTTGELPADLEQAARTHAGKAPRRGGPQGYGPASTTRCWPTGTG